jgi:hypothetical protein
MKQKTTADRLRQKLRNAPDRNGTERQRPAANGGNDASSPSPSPVIFTAADLMRMQLPPQRWAAEGIFPEGLTCLAGKPKLGKSWLVLHLALAVSAGGIFLGQVEVEVGEVLYISLEDTKRRLQSRIRKLLGPGEQPSPRLHLAHDWPRMGRGGVEAIEEWVVDHPGARLVAIDTWARFRPVRRGRNDNYEIDYADGAEVKALADRRQVSVLGTHHCRKMGAADAVEEVSGSVGLTGACDGIVVMRRERGQADATLTVTGRDVDEAELALAFRKENCLWQLMGNADDYRVSKERAEILALFAGGKVLSPKEVETLTGKPGPAVRQLLSKMAHDGQLVATERGKYRAPVREPDDEPPNPFIPDGE